MVERIRLATVERIMSPLAWPKKSFITLNRSRSKKRIAVFWRSFRRSVSCSEQRASIRQPRQFVVHRVVQRLLFSIDSRLQLHEERPHRLQHAKFLGGPCATAEMEQRERAPGLAGA